MPESVKQPLKIKSRAEGLLKTAERVLPGWLLRFSEIKTQRWMVIIATSFVAAFIMAPYAAPVYEVTIGQPAKETIVAPKSFRVFDDAATQNNRDQALKSIWPVYDFDDEMVYDVQAKIAAAFKFMRDYLAEEATFMAGPKMESPKEPAAEDAESATPPVTQPRVKPFVPLDDTTLRTRFENLLGTTVAPSSFYAFKINGFNSVIERDLRSPVVPRAGKGRGR